MEHGGITGKQSTAGKRYIYIKFLLLLQFLIAIVNMLQYFGSPTSLEFS